MALEMSNDILINLVEKNSVEDEGNAAYEKSEAVKVGFVLSQVALYEQVVKRPEEV
jgi:hypothetical protein